MSREKNNDYTRGDINEDNIKARNRFDKEEKSDTTSMSSSSVLPNKQIFNHPDSKLSNPPNLETIGEKNIVNKITKEEQAEKEAELNYQKSIEEPLDTLALEKPSGILQFFYIPGILLLSVMLGYLSGRLRLSYISIFFICYALYFIFSRQMKKFRRSLISTIIMDQRKSKVKNNWESVEWMNYSISRLWTVLEPKISKEIFKKVNPILGEKCPSFLSRLRLSEFTLGSKPPHITGISFHEDVDDDVIQIDFEIGYVPLEIGQNLRSKILKNKKFQWNSKIILVARLGTATKGIGVDLPIMVKNILFTGEGRVILRLTKELPLIKNVEFLFLNKPEIDFTLKPLKSVDIMDLPGLSDVIFSTIDSGLSKSLVNPNSIIVDLQKIEEEKNLPIGVLYVQVLRIDSNKDCTYGLQIDGKKLFYTKEINNGRIDEYFYLILERDDDLLEFCMKTKSTDSIIGDGTVKIKKLLMTKNFNEDIKIYNKGEAKNRVSCNFSFFPFISKTEKKRHPSNSAILKIDILNIEDIQATGCSRSKVYSSFCTIIAGPKEEFIRKTKGKGPNPFNLVTGTAKFVGGALNTAGGLVSGALGMDNENEEHAYPPSSNTCFLAKTRKILETNSPNFDESYRFFVRNIDSDYIYIFLWEENNSEWIGRVEIPIKEIQDNEEKYYKLRDAQDGRIKLRFNMVYINEKDNAIEVAEKIQCENEIIGKEEEKNIHENEHYTKAVRINIKKVNSIYDNGVFNIIAKTSDNSFFVPNFCIGEFPIFRTLMIPTKEKDFIKLYLFKKNIKGDEYIGNGILMENGNIVEPLEDNESVTGKESKTIEVDIFENLEDVGSVFCEVEEEPLVEYKGVEMYKDNIKIIETTIEDCEINDKFYIEFRNTRNLINRSRLYNGKQLQLDNKQRLQSNEIEIYEKPDRYLFIVGESEIKANFYSGELNTREKIGECFLPKRKTDEKLHINAKNTVKIRSNAYTCNFKLKENITQGIVTLKIINCKNVKGVDSNGLSDPYIKIFLNGKKIHKTKVIKKNVNPVFNESTSFTSNIELDTLRIEIKDYNAIESNKMIGYREFPLCFLDEGMVKLSLDILDSKTYIKSNTKLQLEIDFRDIKK
ncbi:Ca2+-dependent lipid-binding protein [Spraguea lophii 42_110]|uniref:Ca2+-dependent lipid-binding protein n=1 Tax=Spraguea lophii (strain 42_110) TaxID=1358809 RepID=S7XHD6_SPRLO|nr:Ca2+-dependent lipid-binding protein [Spraguea lophii 42_110]